MTDERTPKYPVSRQDLYELAWSQPMTSIGKIFGVSSSYLARVFTMLNVPRPAPGYWAKVAAGKKVSKPSLPDPGPNDLLVWDRYNDAPLYSRPVSQPQESKPTRSKAIQYSKLDTHPLIRGAKVHFLKTRESRLGYLRPYKYNLLDLIVSKDHLDIALTAINKLFLSIEEYNYKISLSLPNELSHNRPKVDEREIPDRSNRYSEHWSPGRKTLVFVGPIAYGLTIFEYSENLECVYKEGRYIPITKSAKRNSYQHWTSHHDFPTGRFCLRAYSPYHGTSWSHQWDFKPDHNMVTFAQKVTEDLAKNTNTIARLVKEAKEEAERQRQEWEEEQLRWKEEEVIRRKTAAHKQSSKELLQVIEKWGEIKRIESFFDEIEQAAASMPAGTSDSVIDKLVKAKALIGNTDAVKFLLEWQAPDEILDL